MSVAPRPGLTLRGPGELIAAIPTLLGFRPAPGSLVLVVYTNSESRHVIEAVARVDLPQPDLITGLVDQLIMVLGHHNPSGVALLVLGGHTTTPGVRLPGREVVDAITTRFARCGIAVLDALWAPSADPSCPWKCYVDTNRGGVIPDPATLPLVAALTVAGHVTFASRAELAAVLTPDPADVLARRADLITTQPPVDAVRETVFLFELVERIHTTPGAERTLDDATIARLATALAHGQIRDVCLALCLGEHAGTAERLWTVLTRAVPRALVAHPAFLLGLCAYLRGDGALAGIALDRAVQVNPDHPVAGPIRHALNHGMPPTTLRAGLSASVLAAPHQ